MQADPIRTRLPLPGNPCRGPRRARWRWPRTSRRSSRPTVAGPLPSSPPRSLASAAPCMPRAFGGGITSAFASATARSSRRCSSRSARSARSRCPSTRACGPDDIAYCLRQSRVRLLFAADRVLSSDFNTCCPRLGPSPCCRPTPFRTSPGSSWSASRSRPGPKAGTDFLAEASADEPAERSLPGDVILIQYTSGSTGFPKGVMLRQHSLLTNGFVSGTGWACGSPTGSTAPARSSTSRERRFRLCLPAGPGVTLVTMARFEATEALRMMEVERCTHFSGNDTMALMLLNHPDGRAIG